MRFSLPEDLYIYIYIYMFIMQEHLVTERKERPVSMNAFELISRSPSFNLENLFEKQTVCISNFHFLVMNISNMALWEIDIS